MTRRMSCIFFFFWFFSPLKKTATEQVITRTLSFIEEKCSKPCEYSKGFLFLFYFTLPPITFFPSMSIALQLGLLNYLTFTKHILLFCNCVLLSTLLPYQILKHLGKTAFPDTKLSFMIPVYPLHNFYYRTYHIIVLCVCLLSQVVSILSERTMFYKCLYHSSISIMLIILLVT